MTTVLKPKVISQHKLKRYWELEKLVKEHAELKKEIMALAEQGLPAQRGPMGCRVDITPSTSIAWKQYFIDYAGQDEADKIAADCKGNSERRKLVVTNRNEPLQG